LIVCLHLLSLFPLFSLSIIFNHRLLIGLRFRPHNLPVLPRKSISP
jgi:hypothetical protein